MLNIINKDTKVNPLLTLNARKYIKLLRLVVKRFVFFCFPLLKILVFLNLMINFSQSVMSCSLQKMSGRIFVKAFKITIAVEVLTTISYLFLNYFNFCRPFR